ncbi:MAG TPA: trypsin-like peptidase domain-containing protein [Acidimicrobiia bacterium]|nr:trypsin-like peptidase domain-containing protein [Acidimicrobiia bacterium]
MTEHQQVPEPRRSSGWLSGFLFFGAVALVVAGIMWLYPKGSGTESVSAGETTTTVAAPEDINVVAPTYAPGGEPIADAAETILPSVVHIDTAGGLGSGVIYDSDGLIITAAHVVEGSDSVRIRFANGEQVSGTVIGRAPQVDIAVIEVDKTGLPAATFNTAKPRVGQTAIAVGSPWGLESTVTAGIISAIDQTNCSADTCTSMVQTDAAINPGNSGGALVDRDGQVVGINVSIFSESGANDGVGFAVPSDIAVTYADGLISGEPIETAFLGVQADNVNSDGQAGATITVVVPGSAAQSAGILEGDVVVGFDGVPILGFPDLVAQVRSHQPGEVVDVIVLRDGVEQTIPVTLGVDEEDIG